MTGTTEKINFVLFLFGSPSECLNGDTRIYPLGYARRCPRLLHELSLEALMAPLLSQLADIEAHLTETLEAHKDVVEAEALVLVRYAIDAQSDLVEVIIQTLPAHESLKLHQLVPRLNTKGRTLHRLTHVLVAIDAVEDHGVALPVAVRHLVLSR